MTRHDVLTALGMTPSQLAAALGRDRPVVSNWSHNCPLPRAIQFEIAYRFPKSGLKPEAKFLTKGNRYDGAVT